MKERLQGKMQKSYSTPMAKDNNFGKISLAIIIIFNNSNQ